MVLDAREMDARLLNERVRQADCREIRIEHCLGQRYIGAGSAGKAITLEGTPGNALGAYLDGSDLTVHGNAQDALGDTMNGGNIYVYGSAGDAAGYAMRGGRILIHGDAGYRAGIHMKAYQDKVPILVIGGTAGSFLGEYQAGGLIVVLGLDTGRGRPTEPPVGYFCGTGMHGGKIFLRTEKPPESLPPQVLARVAPEEELAGIRPLLEEFCQRFGEDLAEVTAKPFYLLTPDTSNPYRQLYTAN